MEATPGSRAGSRPCFASPESLDACERLILREPGRSTLSAARFRRDDPALGVTLPNEPADTLMAVINLRPLAGDDLWCDGRALRRPPMEHGDLAVFDQRFRWKTRLLDPFETIHVFLPIDYMNELAEELHGRRMDPPATPATAAQHDPVMLHLVLALLPALARPNEANRLFLGHVFEAIRLHLAATYGRIELPHEAQRGGLAPWQERRVKELLFDNLAADHPLSELAEACGISTRHFARAFKATTGATPHRWLLDRRVERAKELLAKSDESVSCVALSCGFADQSHLTRVFHERVGASPGAWRRQHRH